MHQSKKLAQNESETAARIDRTDMDVCLCKRRRSLRALVEPALEPANYVAIVA